MLDEDELELLARLCREHDLIAITDEVYEHLVYDGPPRAARDAAGDVGAHADRLVARQDAFADGLEGRLGDRPRRARRARARRQAVPQLRRRHAAPARRGGRPRAARPTTLAASLRAKRDRLAAGLREAGFEVLPSAGTYFLNADARPLGEDDAARLCQRLPHEAGVAAIPLSAFSSTPQGAVRSIVRFAFCKRDDVLDEAIEALTHAERRVARGGARRGENMSTGAIIAIVVAALIVLAILWLVGRRARERRLDTVATRRARSGARPRSAARRPTAPRRRPTSAPRGRAARRRQRASKRWWPRTSSARHATGTSRQPRSTRTWTRRRPPSATTAAGWRASPRMGRRERRRRRASRADAHAHRGARAPPRARRAG